MLEPAPKPTLVSSANLTVSQKTNLWAGIRAINPRLAGLIKKRAMLSSKRHRPARPIKLPLNQFHRYAQAGTVERINTASLAPAEQQQLFSGMRRVDPDQAAFLENDPNIQQLLSQFGGGHDITLPDYHRYMAAGEIEK